MRISLFKIKAVLAALAAVFLLTGCSASTVDGPRGNYFSSNNKGKKGSVSESEDPVAEIDLSNFSASLSKDPLNSRKIRFDEGVLTILGEAGDQGIEEVLTDFPADVDLSRNGSTFTCTITYTSSASRYGTVEIVNANYQNNYIRVKLGHGAISMPNVLGVAESNQDLARADIPKDLPAVTLTNITVSGNKQRAAEVLAEVKALSDKICRGLTSEYDKLRAISRWVSENIYYDHPAFNAGIPQKCLTLEYILENRSGVCGSYANITAALCQAQGILCYNVDGEAIPSINTYAEQNRGEAHEWNYAYINGRGIWVDSGWNSYNHLYAYGVTVDGNISCKYFDIGNEILALDHKAYSLSNRDFFDPDLLV